MKNPLKWKPNGLSLTDLLMGILLLTVVIVGCTRCTPVRGTQTKAVMYKPTVCDVTSEDCYFQSLGYGKHNRITKMQGR